jgi:hypothetical protein
MVRSLLEVEMGMRVSALLLVVFEPSSDPFLVCTDRSLPLARSIPGGGPGGGPGEGAVAGPIAGPGAEPATAAWTIFLNSRTPCSESNKLRSTKNGGGSSLIPLSSLPLSSLPNPWASPECDCANPEPKSSPIPGSRSSDRLRVKCNSREPKLTRDPSGFTNNLSSSTVETSGLGVGNRYVSSSLDWGLGENSVCLINGDLPLVEPGSLVPGS